MTIPPRSRASNLITEYFNKCQIWIPAKSINGWGRINYQACELALIAVDNIIEQWDYIDTYLGDGNGELNPNLAYWYKVKECIKIEQQKHYEYRKSE